MLVWYAKPTMSYTSALIERVLIIRWGTPQLEDVAAVLREAKAAKESKGTVYGLAIVPSDVEPPEDSVRKAMVASMDELLESCDSLHFVMEGSGFKHSIMRSVLSGLLLMAGKRGRIYVHDTVDAALVAIGTRIKVSSDTLRRLARAKGLLGN